MDSLTLSFVPSQLRGRESKTHKANLVWMADGKDEAQDGYKGTEEYFCFTGRLSFSDRWRNTGMSKSVCLLLLFIYIYVHK